MPAVPPFIADAHARTTADVCASMGVDRAHGLGVDVARARLAEAGPNALPPTARVPLWRRVAAQFSSPLILLLIAAAAVSFAVWAIEGHGGAPHEALTILALVVLNGVLGYAQEARAERALASLARMSAATAIVTRDGVRAVIAAADLVPGDLIVLEEGAAIPADARIVAAAGLCTIESALTGESTITTKDEGPVAQDAVVADRTSMVYAGTNVVLGHGDAIVTATASATEFGRIASLLRETQSEATPLTRELDRLGRLLGGIVIAVAVVVAATILIMQHDYTTAALIGVMLYTISLAVAAVPEGLAAVTAVVLALGTQRMAKRNAIVRKLAAVESLGAATVVACDKTGTLTENAMTVRAIVSASGRVELTGAGYAPHGTLVASGEPLAAGPLRVEALRLLAAGYLASNAELVRDGDAWTVIGDPTEGALKSAALKAGLTPQRLAARFARIGELPFSASRRMMSAAHSDGHLDGAHVLFVKGAPDVLLARCDHERVGNEERLLGGDRRIAIESDVAALAGRALRTLGLAYRRLPADAARLIHESAESELVWLGVVGMADPPRPQARAAVAAAHSAGVRVLMITGDHPVAAAAIAAEIGIAPLGSRVVTGAEMAAMDERALRDVTAHATVYARVAPEQKLAIVRALQANSEVVAMTGDGVNDAPALKAADIGIAMGRAGTDVAREAADMVLADDNFATIVAAIEEGRSIYANLQKFLAYLLSTNLGEVFVLFLGVVLAGTLGLVAGRGEALVLPLLATQILWINLVTDGFPALALGVDPADPNLMHRPPRDPRSGVIVKRMWIAIGVVAVVTGTGTLMLLDAALPGGLIDGDHDIVYARTVTFNVLVLYQLVYALTVRTSDTFFARPFANGWLWLAVGAGLVLQALVVYVPSLNAAFGTVPLSASDWAVCALVALTVAVAHEALKWRFRASDRVAPQPMPA